MTQYICNRNGRTKSCHRCPEGKPHDKRETSFKGLVIVKTLCTESVPFQEVKDIEVKESK